MEYILGVSNVYAFLEAVTTDRHTDARKRISVQKRLSELGLAWTLPSNKYIFMLCYGMHNILLTSGYEFKYIHLLNVKKWYINNHSLTYLFCFCVWLKVLNQLF